MSPNFKKIIAVILSAGILAIAYFGSYLPFRKSRLFISTIRDLGTATSLNELEKRISSVLDFPSPIGHEELVRQFGNTILSLINQTNNQPEIVSQVVNFLGDYYQPIVNSGRGMSFNQNLYILGAMNELAFVKTNQPPYLEAAERYFSLSRELGPQRPQSLYGLFDVYRIKGDLLNTDRIAQIILNQWPDDVKTKEALDAFHERLLTGKQ